MGWFTISRMMIIIGVLMTVGSAAISHKLIAENEVSIMQEENEMQLCDDQIRDTWQILKETERREDVSTLMAILIAEQEPMPQALEMAAIHMEELMLMAGVEAPESLPPLTPQTWQQWQGTLESVLRDYKRQLTDKIDTLYMGRMERAETVSELRRENHEFRGYALLLQILGLILVLSNRMFDSRDADNLTGV